MVQKAYQFSFNDMRYEESWNLETSSDVLKKHLIWQV